MQLAKHPVSSCSVASGWFFFERLDGFGVWLPWLALLGYGIVGLHLSGMETNDGVAYIILVLATLFVAAFAFAINEAPANRLGRKTLTTLAKQHRGLKEHISSPGHTLGASMTATGIALYGEDALKNSAPELAWAVGLSKPSSGKGDSGGGGDNGGGDGGE